MTNPPPKAPSSAPSGVAANEPVKHSASRIQSLTPKRIVVGAIVVAAVAAAVAAVLLLSSSPPKSITSEKSGVVIDWVMQQFIAAGGQKSEFKPDSFRAVYVKHFDSAREQMKLDCESSMRHCGGKSFRDLSETDKGYVSESAHKILDPYTERTRAMNKRMEASVQSKRPDQITDAMEDMMMAFGDYDGAVAGLLEAGVDIASHP